MAHFDRYETRTPRSREAAQFRDLRGILAGAKPRAPSLRAQLRDIDITKLRSPADLLAIPIVRRHELLDSADDAAPLGGFVAARPGRLRRLFPLAGAAPVPEGAAKDWWSSARAFHASGARRGDVLINCLIYHLTPYAYMVEAAAAAIGCAIIPAGPDDVQQQIEAISGLKPRIYCGSPEHFDALADAAAAHGRDLSSVRRAVILGAPVSPAILRRSFAERGVLARQIYATPELGVIAYETETIDGSLVEGMIVNESCIVEIIRPDSNEPATPGEIGEVVVTRLSIDCPLLRFATGDLAAVLAEPSPCGRTNMRIRGPVGRIRQNPALGSAMSPDLAPAATFPAGASSV